MTRLVRRMGGDIERGVRGWENNEKEEGEMVWRGEVEWGDAGWGGVTSTQSCHQLCVELELGVCTFRRGGKVKPVGLPTGYVFGEAPFPTTPLLSLDNINMLVLRVM